MSQCKREGCDKPSKGKGVYCSGACRTKVSRASRASVSRESLPSVTRDTVGPEYVTVEGKCYNRPAVACIEFGVRPAPLDLADVPKAGNRGKFVRPDGSEYQFDSQGNSFECPHEAFDARGRRRTEVYTTADFKGEAA